MDALLNLTSNYPAPRPFLPDGSNSTHGPDDQWDLTEENPLILLFGASLLLLVCGGLCHARRSEAAHNRMLTNREPLAVGDPDVIEQKRQAALQSLPVFQWGMNEQSEAPSLAEPSASVHISAAGSVKMVLKHLSRKMRSRRQPVQEECSLCLCEYENGEVVTRLPCGHCYHHECIHTWFDAQRHKDRFCPLCKRSPLTPEGALLCEPTAPLIASTSTRHVHVDIPIAPPEGERPREAPTPTDV